MHVVWMRQLVHEYAKDMHRAEELVNKCGNMVKAICGRSRFGKKSGQAGSSSNLVQEVLGPCEAKDGTNN